MEKWSEQNSRYTYDTPPFYSGTIVGSTKDYKTFSTKLFRFEPACDYPDNFSWTVSPTPVEQFSTFDSASDIVGI